MWNSVAVAVGERIEAKGKGNESNIERWLIFSENMHQSI